MNVILLQFYTILLYITVVYVFTIVYIYSCKLYNIKLVGFSSLLVTLKIISILQSFPLIVNGSVLQNAFTITGIHYKRSH